MSETLGDRIRARRDAQRESLEALKDELKSHIDEHVAILHARIDKLEEGA